MDLIGKRYNRDGINYVVVDQWMESDGRIMGKLESETCPLSVIHLYLGELAKLNMPQDNVKGPDKKSTELKLDKGKPDLSLIDRTFVEAAARALMFGAEKYSRDGYKEMSKEDIPRIYAALLRHTFKKCSGETIDVESGLDHTDHIAACVNIITFLENKYK